MTATSVTNAEKSQTKKMKGIMQIGKFFEESAKLPEGPSETVENETKEQKGGFLVAVRYIRC